MALRKVIKDGESILVKSSTQMSLSDSESDGVGET